MEKNIEKLKTFIFEDELANLVSKNPEFSDVKRQYTEKDSKVRADIAAHYKNKLYIIECKGLSAFSTTRLDDVIFQLIQYRKYFNLGPNVQLTLAFPGELSELQQIKLASNGIELWDIHTLSDIFFHQLNSITSPQLKELLQSAKKDKFSIEDKLIKKLNNCPKGSKSWSLYQKICTNIFEHLFCPPLGKPITELSDYLKVNRRDIVLPNYCENGFWSHLRLRYRADYIVIDAKNHSSKIEKVAILQMANYLKDYGAGLFGIITYRNGVKESTIQTQREIWVAQQKLIIFVNDSDIESMLRAKRRSGDPEEIIKQKIENFRLSL